MTSKYTELSDLLHRYVIWNKGREVPGLDRWVWRDDAHGRRIRFTDYGDRNSPYGWEIDHFPVAKALGGSDHYDNLRPLHHYGNSSHGGMLGGLLGLGAKASKSEVPAGLTGLLARHYERPRNTPPTQLSGLLGLGADLTHKRAPGGLFGLGADRD